MFPTYVRQNVLASQRLFEAAVAAGARTVLASSSSIYGDAASYPTPEDTSPRPLSPYGITKLACEHLASAYGQEFGLVAVTLRYFTIYGPRQRPDMALARMVACVAEDRPFELFGDGTQSRSFTYVDDAVEATIAAMERGSAGATYNVGGGEEVSVLQALEALASIAGRRLEVVRSPRGGRRARTAADTSSIEADLGWEARRRSSKASRLSGAGPLIGSRPHDGRQSGSSSRKSRRSISSSAWQRLKERWWLPVGGLVLGRCLASRSPSPEAPSGGRRRSSTSASRSPRSAAARSRASPRTRARSGRSCAPKSALQAASRASGIPVSKLRSSVSTKELTAVGQLRGINPLMEIAVKADGKRKAELAAQALSTRGRGASEYVTQKVEDLENQVSVSRAQLAAIESRIETAQRQQDALIGDQSIPLDTRLLLSANLNSVITTADARRTSLQEALLGAAAPQPRRERREEPGRRAGGRQQDDRALEPDVAPRRASSDFSSAPSRPSPPSRSCVGGPLLGLMLDGKRVAVVVPAYDEERPSPRRSPGSRLRRPRLRRRRRLARRDGRARRDDGGPARRGDPTSGEPRCRRGHRLGLPEGARGGDRRRLRDGGRQPDGPRRAPGARRAGRPGEVEYAKANRLFLGEAWQVIPRTRYLGNAVLSLLTKIASGYWHVADSQAGYTALSCSALARLDLDRLYPRYGFPNDLLVHLNVQNARVRDVLPPDLRRRRAVGHPPPLGRAAHLLAPPQRASGGGWARST